MRNLPLAIAAAVLAGCAAPSPNPFVLVAAVDVSCPKEELVARYGAELYRIQRALGPDARLDVYRFADVPELVYSGRPLYGRHAFNARFGGLLAQAAGRPSRPGTRPDRLFEAFAGTGTGIPAVYVVLTDGGIEGRSAPELASVAGSLGAAASSRGTLGFAVVGVRPEHRLLWRGLLGPLGARAVLKGLEDASDVPDLVSAWAREGSK